MLSVVTSPIMLSVIMLNVFMLVAPNFRSHDTEINDTLYDGIQHRNEKCNTQNNDAQHGSNKWHPALWHLMLSVIFVMRIYAEDSYTDCRYAENRYTDCHYAKCYCVKYRFAGWNETEFSTLDVVVRELQTSCAL